MKNHTFRERLIAGLKALGATPATSASRKYDTFVTLNNRYYVGKNGALRIGRSASDSISIGDPASIKSSPHYCQILGLGDKALANKEGPAQ